MSAPQRTVVHVYRLTTGTKLLLAAVALGLVMNALAPFLHVQETRAQNPLPGGLLHLACEGVLPKHGEMLNLNCAGATL